MMMQCIYMLTISTLLLLCWSFFLYLVWGEGRREAVVVAFGSFGVGASLVLVLHFLDHITPIFNA